MGTYYCLCDCFYIWHNQKTPLAWIRFDLADNLAVHRWDYCFCGRELPNRAQEK